MLELGLQLLAVDIVARHSALAALHSERQSA